MWIHDHFLQLFHSWFVKKWHRNTEGPWKKNLTHTWQICISGHSLPIELKFFFLFGIFCIVWQFELYGCWKWMCYEASIYKWRNYVWVLVFRLWFLPKAWQFAWFVWLSGMGTSWTWWSLRPFCPLIGWTLVQCGDCFGSSWCSLMCVTYVLLVNVAI